MMFRSAFRSGASSFGRTGTLLAVTLLLVASVLAFMPAPQAAAAQCQGRTLDARLVPSCGTLLGSSDRHVDWMDMGTQEYKLGAALDMVRIYKVGPNARFFTNHEWELLSQGKKIVYSWKVATQRTDVSAWKQVARGDHDENLRRVARQIRDSGQTVIFGLHHEPENDPTFGSNADYANMYRRAHSIMEPIAGDKLVWFINYMGHSDGGFDQVEAMYPGDDIIDWISYNPYNWYGCHANSPWKTFETQARNFYNWAQQNHPSKPLMIGETATNELPGDPNAKARWIDDMGASITNQFPAIRAVLWFHQNNNSGFCERRWDSSQQSVEAFRRVRNSPHFGGGAVATQQQPQTQPQQQPQQQPQTQPQQQATGGPNCSVTTGVNGVYLSYNPVQGAVTHVYRVDVPGQASRYGEVQNSGSFVPVTGGGQAQVFLSGKFSNGSYTPSSNCGTGTASNDPVQCWVRPIQGGVHAEWHPFPGASSFVYRISIPGRADNYGTAYGTNVGISLPRGTTATIAVGAVYPNGSYSPAGNCGTTQAG